MLVNQKELSQILGITTRHIRNLKEEGLFEVEKDSKKYSLKKCVQEYINYKINAEMGKGTFLEKEKIQAKHEEIKMQISILKLRKIKKEVHEAKYVEDFLIDMLTNFKNILLSLPTKLAMQIVGEQDINIIVDILNKSLNEILQELSEYNPQDIGSEAEDLEDEQEEE